jgi:hypothetical protein
MTGESTGAHEWLVEFETHPEDFEAFVNHLDEGLKAVNTDYAAKRSFDLNLRRPIVRTMPSGTFYEWLKSKGKVGGQHKVPRLSNDRSHVDALLEFSTAFRDNALVE